MLDEFEIRPTAYNINAYKSENTIEFNLKQDDTAPRKIEVEGEIENFLIE